MVYCNSSTRHMIPYWNDRRWAWRPTLRPFENIYDIQRMIHELTWIAIFCHEWGDSAMIFTIDEVTSENHCRITSRVTKIIIQDEECIILFLTRYIMPWTHISPKLSSNAYFTIVAKGSLFWLSIVTSLQLICDARYWHCDVIFVDCHCTCKLA